GRPASDASDSCSPGLPSTLSVNGLAWPRLRGGALPAPTVAPTTVSATATVTVTAAIIAARLLRSTPAQLDGMVTVPPPLPASPAPVPRWPRCRPSPPGGAAQARTRCLRPGCCAP